MLLHAGLADAAICGGTANWWRQMRYILPIIPRRPGVSRVYGLGCLILPHGTLFICDTHMVVDPDRGADRRDDACSRPRRSAEFGITPKAALLSHSNFGASDSESARKMRRALALIRERAPELEVDGEMHADAALVEAIRDQAVPDSRLARHGEPAGHADAGCGEHRVHPAEGGVGRAAGGADAAGHEQADPRAGAQRDGARHRQSQCVRGAVRGGGVGASPTTQPWNGVQVGIETIRQGFGIGIGSGMHTIYNARIQLLATAVNNLGVGAVMAGFVAPLVNGSVGDLAHVGVWFVLGADLVAMAQIILGRLR